MKKSIAVMLLALSPIAAAQVRYDRLVIAGEDGANWLTYSGTYRSERYSPLDEINAENVSRLKVIWAYQMQPSTDAGDGLVETTRIVVDGILYLTEPPSTVTALDTATGDRLWRFHTVPARGEPGSETRENDAWQTGGGSTWLSGSFDPALDLLYTRSSTSSTARPASTCAAASIRNRPGLAASTRTAARS